MQHIRTIIFRIAVVIFSVELLAMLLLFLLDISLSPLLEAVLDGIFLIVCSSPIIYIWIIKPYIQDRELAEQALMNSQTVLEIKITERTQELEKKKLEAEKANRVKSEFLSHMSHELRTPLNAVLGFAQLLWMDKTLSAFQHNQIKYINNAGKHLLCLIEDVLDLSRIESGRIDIVLAPVNYKEVLMECIELIRPLARQRQIEIINEDSGQNHETLLQADRTRLKEIVLNLLSNAVKYNKEGGKIILSTQTTEYKSRRIYVTDTGKGLCEEQYTNLFQPFNRLGAERGQVEGTGIGLVISKHLIQMMGGHIGYEPQKTEGSRFWIELKASDKSACLGSEAVKNITMPADESSSNKSQSVVLYIEDSPSNIRLVEYLIGNRPNVRLIIAFTPEQGLELAIEHQPNLIFLGINLFDMTDIEVLQQLHENNMTNKIPVVAISANLLPEHIETSKQFGLVDYISKPIDVFHFYDIIDKINH